MKKAITAAIAATLNMADALREFAERSERSRITYLELGILRCRIEDLLPKGKNITDVMQKSGIKLSQISNSSYAAKVYRLLVTDNGFDEKEFLSMATARLCRTIIQACGLGREVPAFPLNAKRVLEIIAMKKRGDLEEELRCRAEHGCLLAEKAKRDAEAKKAATPPVTPPVTPPATPPVTTETKTTETKTTKNGTDEESMKRAIAEMLKANGGSPTPPTETETETEAPETPEEPKTETPETPKNEKPKNVIPIQDHEPEIVDEVRSQLTEIQDIAFDLSPANQAEVIAALRDLANEIESWTAKKTKNA